MKYTVLDTQITTSPRRDAQTFGACLAADRHVGSTLVRIDGRTWDCVADDNRAIRFTSLRNAKSRLVANRCFRVQHFGGQS